MIPGYYNLSYISLNIRFYVVTSKILSDKYEDLP